MKPKYYTMEKMIGMLDEPNRSACARLVADNRKLFQTVQGSTNNHQAWPGGYFDHVQEIMNIAILLYRTLKRARPLPFSLSDLLLVVFLHDVEKPWKYELLEDGQLHHILSMQTKANHQAFRIAKLTEYGIQLTPEHENGIAYAEGELNNYSPRERRAGRLASVAHMCDHCSARLWFDHPMETSDPWPGAHRMRD